MVWSNERSPELLHSKLRTGATYSPWLSDQEFLKAYDAVKDFTRVDIYRCYELWSLAKQAAAVPGSILEVGVWRGGTGCLLALAAPAKLVYLADTFKGVVKAGAQDTRYVGGEHADTSEQVAWELLERTGAANARLLRGIFPEETAAWVSGPISLLHVDVDVYQSGKDVVEWVLPHLPVGAAIVFDDYGFLGCEGITRLVHEMRGSLKDFTFIHNLNGHGIFIRTSKP
ncbi:MAG TPA: TylF/MycF/NovP-related O-methyltransferase [Candidatus Dormibacteraeota bacterium]|nr:TylF/MycF/NovP-related O-methyltransferase [Candidatus Dormibacteraeota bacterium]